MGFEQLNIRVPSEVKLMIPRGNATRWVIGAIKDRYAAEVERGREPIPGYLGWDRPPPPPPKPIVSDDPAPLIPPQRSGWWLPTSEEMETGVYAVLPETFAVNDEGAWHFVQVVPGPSYPYGDNWPGVKAKWKPAETPGPFTPSPGVLSAAIASDAARVAALIARHPR